MKERIRVMKPILHTESCQKLSVHIFGVFVADNSLICRGDLVRVLISNYSAYTLLSRNHANDDTIALTLTKTEPLSETHRL